MLAKMFLEESTQVDFLVGRALNPAHQNPGMPVSLGLKLNLIKELAAAIEKTGKTEKIAKPTANSGTSAIKEV